ncbi:response regulator [Paenibacillus cymbidii]|uniref:response regulator n=1 Tax=Paenibacillus cymbidii TaxID=1639034 RepID=UPI0014368A7B|nr:response regulator [Paenibacillus cymbidii]
MHQVLMIDDEESALEALHLSLPWEELGVGAVHKAYSGYEALQLLRSHAIDIVITDIRMPGMNGLQLIEQIRERWPHCKCILLSGHAEFHYAAEAIRQRTEDYLLKPVDDAELIAAIRRAQEKLRREWEDVSSSRRTTQTLREHLPLLRDHLLCRLLRDKRPDDGALNDKMAGLQLPFAAGDNVSMMTVRLEQSFYEYSPDSLPLFEYAIVNMMEEIFGTYFDMWSCRDHHHYLVVLLKMKADIERQVMAETDDWERHRQKWVERLSMQLQHYVGLYLKGRVSLIVGRWGRLPDDIAPMYETMVLAMRRTVGSDHELFVTPGETPAHVYVTPIQSLHEPPALIRLLEGGQWDAARSRLQAVFDELAGHAGDTGEHLAEIVHTAASAFYFYSHKNGRQLADLLGDDALFVERHAEHRHLAAVRDWTLRALARLKEDMQREVKGGRAEIVRQVRAYIDSKLAVDVSLQAIADHVYMHPVYLSKIYKAETGEALSDYLFRLRMDKAAHLLKSGADKVYEIAAQLGYASTPHFIKTFRNHFGVTPQEFRDS